MRGQGERVAIYSGHSTALFLLSVSLIILAVLVSCGLPTADYLYPPSYFENTGASQLIIQHNNGNAFAGNGFIGYAIYYRAFDNFNIAQTSYTSISSSLSSSNIKSIALSNGYFPLLKINSIDASKYDFSTLISSTDCESGVYDRFLINMKNDSLWTLQGVKTSDSSLTTLASIVRDKNTALSPSQADFSIQGNYNNGDQDYSGADAPANIYFVFFAVACGTSTSSLMDIYSNPADSSANAIILIPEAYDPSR